METLTLVLKAEPQVPLEVEGLSPSFLAGKSAREVGSLPLQYGREKVPLGEFFAIKGNRAGEHLHLEGNLSRVKYLGAGMEGGLLTISGPVGMHLGAGMKSGEIKVEGRAGDWVGAGMRGGLIRLKGSAGHRVGAGYWGEKRGMAGGTILIEGDAGHDVGARMGRGLIVITGACGDFAGAEMGAGTILVLGRCGVHPGANMKRGTIILAQETNLLPTFFYSCSYRPVFLSLLWSQLGAHGLRVPPALQKRLFARFQGDSNHLGKGEILLCKEKAST